jgi:hypothetical protein
MGTRQAVMPNDGTDAACFAYVPKILQQAIADVDHGGR